MFLAAGCYGRHRHPSWGWAMAFFQARKWSLVGPGAWAFYAVWGRSKNQDCMPVAANYNSCPLRDVFFVPLLGFPLFKKKHEKTTLAFYHYEAQIMGRWHFPARLLLLIPYGFLPWGADAPSLGVWVESFLWSFQTWRIWSISKHHGKLFSRVFDLIFAPRQRLPDLDVVSLISMNFHTNTCTTCKDCRNILPARAKAH